MNFLKNHRKLKLFLVSVPMILIPLFIYGCGNKSSKKGVEGLAYVFTDEGVNVIDIRDNTVKEQWAGIPKSSWPDNWGNKDNKILWANIGKPSDVKGLFALDTKTRSVTKVFTNSTSGNWGIQSPDRRWVYAAARHPAQKYLKIGGDPAFSDFATVVDSIPMTGANIQPGKSGPGP